MPFCAPQIVYSNSWLGQTASIPNAVVFNAPADGLYRLSASIFVQNTTGYTAPVSVALNWDRLASGGATGITITGSGVPSPDYMGNADAVIVSIANGRDVVVGATVTDSSVLSYFDLRVTIEQLA